MTYEIERIALDRLVPYARNSRTHSDAQVAQIAASIQEFGFTNPVLVDERGGIIAGHGRVLAAKKLGQVEVPCIRLGHLTEAQKRAYVIADNKLALNADWSWDTLAVELDELRDIDFDISLLGFERFELNNLIGTPNAGFDARQEWQGMPEFESEPKGAAQMIVHFKTLEDRAEFVRLIGAKVTDKTRWIWWPDADA